MYIVYVYTIVVFIASCSYKLYARTSHNGYEGKLRVWGIRVMDDKLILCIAYVTVSAKTGLVRIW